VVLKAEGIVSDSANATVERDWHVESGLLLEKREATAAI